MTKPKYSKLEIKKFVADLYIKATSKKFFNYNTLMEKYKPIIWQAKLHLKFDSEAQEQLKEIQRQALIYSVRRLKINERKISYIQDKHPGLERIAKQIYQRINKKSPWQLLVEDAGLRYPCKEQDKWNLKKVLGELSRKGNIPEEFKSKNMGLGFGRAMWKYARGLGKAVILIGIDYLQNKRIQKKKSQFNIDELEKIILDESLDYEDKIKCIFNALVLQYYDWNEYKSKVSRKIDESDEKEKSFNFVRSNKSFKGNLGVSIQQNQENLNLLKVEMSLKKDIENRIHNARFYFSGENAISEALLKFYGNLNNTLERLDNTI